VAASHASRSATRTARRSGRAAGHERRYEAAHSRPTKPRSAWRRLAGRRGAGGGDRMRADGFRRWRIGGVRRRRDRGRRRRAALRASSRSIAHAFWCSKRGPTSARHGARRTLAILHTGFDAKPGTSSRSCSARSSPPRRYAPDAGIPGRAVGALLVAWSDDERATLPSASPARARGERVAGGARRRPAEISRARARRSRRALSLRSQSDESIFCPSRRRSRSPRKRS